MGFRFQKRIKLMPGVTFNLSRKGVSTSIGVTGARKTFGHGQTRTTVGLPGTGLSHTSVKRSAPPAAGNPGVWVVWAILLLVIVWIYAR